MQFVYFSGCVCVLGWVFCVVGSREEGVNVCGIVTGYLLCVCIGLGVLCGW